MSEVSSPAKPFSPRCRSARRFMGNPRWNAEGGSVRPLEEGQDRFAADLGHVDASSHWHGGVVAVGAATLTANIRNRSACGC
jgi:hypothetical protein